MADTHVEISQQLEAHRLELERIKIQFEKERNYLQRWTTDISPVEEELLETHRSAVGIAQMVLRSGFLVNGGALIALPAFIALFQVDASMLVIAAVGCFVAGLLSCGAGAIGAFLTLDNWGVAVIQKREWRAIKQNTESFPDKPENQGANERLDAIDEKRREAERNSRRWFRFSLWACILAFVVFAAGTGTTAYVAALKANNGKTAEVAKSVDSKEGGGFDALP